MNTDILKETPMTDTGRTSTDTTVQEIKQHSKNLVRNPQFCRFYL
jgi:hypothetical protein